MVKPIVNTTATQTMATPPKADAAGQARDAKLKKACAGFESLFLNQMLKSMRDSVGESDLLGGGHGSKMMQAMLDEKVADEVAEHQGMGIGRALYQRLKATDGKVAPSAGARTGGARSAATAGVAGIKTDKQP